MFGFEGIVQCGLTVTINSIDLTIHTVELYGDEARVEERKREGYTEGMDREGVKLTSAFAVSTNHLVSAK